MRWLLIFLVGWMIADACVERINFNLPHNYSTDVVVDGLITNEPGPYTVKLSSVIKTDDTYPLGVPLYAKYVTIFDNVGNSEELILTGQGVYQTQTGGIQGVIGREYHIKVEMEDGSIFESAPDKMNPVGGVDSVYYSFESHPREDQPPAYLYRIFMDGHSSPGEDNYFRWKFNGTYVVETLPQFTHCPSPPCGYCPAPCSGYAFDSQNNIKPIAGKSCSCCRCWVTPREGKPKVSDNQVSANGKFSKIEMGTIPIDFYTFFEKYRVEIVQMSLSRAGFDFWKAIQAQKEGVGSLFQPITGTLPTNLSEVNHLRGVQGIFYASAVTKKQIYLDKSIHPVDIIVPEDFCAGAIRQGAIGMDCRIAFPGSTSTNVQPADWK